MPAASRRRASPKQRLASIKSGQRRPSRAPRRAPVVPAAAAAAPQRRSRVRMPKAAFPKDEPISIQVFFNLPRYFNQFSVLAQAPPTNLMLSEDIVEQTKSDARKYISTQLRPFLYGVVREWYTRLHADTKEEANGLFRQLLKQIPDVYCPAWSPDPDVVGGQELKEVGDLAHPPMVCLSASSIWTVMSGVSGGGKDFLDEIVNDKTRLNCGSSSTKLSALFKIAHAWMTALTDLMRLFVIHTRLGRSVQDKFQEKLFSTTELGRVTVQEWGIANIARLTPAEIRWLFELPAPGSVVVSQPPPPSHTSTSRPQPPQQVFRPQLRLPPPGVLPQPLSQQLVSKPQPVFERPKKNQLSDAEREWLFADD